MPASTTTERNRGFAGARACIYVEGNIKAGWATGVNGTEQIQNQRVDVLDNIDSEEIEAVGRSAQFSMDFVRILKKPLAQMGIWPQGGTAEIVEWPPMMIEVYDTVGDQPVYRLHGCKPSSRNFRVEARSLAGTGTTWDAIRIEEVATA